MVNPIFENTADANADTPTPGGRAAETLVKGGAEALTEIGSASRDALQELAKAYQVLATKNVKTLTAAVQALSSVKSPADFFALQQKVIKDSVESAVADSRHIGELTTALFTAAFAPLKRQIEAVQKTARTQI